MSMGHRFRVLHMSEAPIITPLTRLGEFIAKVGKMPSQEALQVGACKQP